jgi:hypothetical protein
MLFARRSTFVMMPFLFGSLPFDVCFFTCGVIAKRCNWLDSPLPHRWFFAALAGGIAAVWFCAMVANYSHGGGLFMVNKYGGYDMVPPDASLTICRDPRRLDSAAVHTDPISKRTLTCGETNALCTANGTWQPEAPCGEQWSAMDYFASRTPCCSGPFGFRMPVETPCIPIMAT